MGFLINIDNGGTLTDILVADGSDVHYTKTLTTPYDLSQCFFEGIRKISAAIYGQENVAALLQDTECLRYSTTQGTNALIQRKGPRLGLILQHGETTDFLVKSEGNRRLLDDLVGDRVRTVDLGLSGAQFETAIARTVNLLTSSGANRLVVCLTVADYVERERDIKRLVLRAFPRHLLGAVPMLFSHEVVGDPVHHRRAWTTLFNSFLHPAMETFLYNAEHRIRKHKAKQPLRIFRNDGASARVAKTVAVKTYSSGPRGGLEAGKALAAQYGFDRLLTVDVGGTTTDVCLVEDGQIRQRLYGEIEKTEISFALSDIVSLGAGGSSVIKVVDGAIVVGPESVGASPGPACFARGGTAATITDVDLLLGIFDPSSYFGGELTLDAERSRKAIEEHIAGPLGVSLEDALLAMEQTWTATIAGAIGAYGGDMDDVVLAAFGGAGPLAVCSIADQIGVRRIIVPRLAAVFSAFGISFSNIAHDYRLNLTEKTDQALQDALRLASRWAERDMFAETALPGGYRTDIRLVVIKDGAGSVIPLTDEKTLPAGLSDADEILLEYSAMKELPQPTLGDTGAAAPTQARGGAMRRVLGRNGWSDTPVYVLDDQEPGMAGAGPAIIEERYFTSRIPSGWRFELSGAKDILLYKEGDGT